MCAHVSLDYWMKENSERSTSFVPVKIEISLQKSTHVQSEGILWFIMFSVVAKRFVSGHYRPIKFNNLFQLLELFNDQ